MQAVGLVTSDTYLHKYNISIPTDDIIDVLKDISLDRSVIGMDTYFDDLYGGRFATTIGPYGICFTHNVVNAEDLYNDLENSPEIFNYTQDWLVLRQIFKYRMTAVDPYLAERNFPARTIYVNSGFYLRLWGFKMAFFTFSRRVSSNHDSYVFNSPQIIIHDPYGFYGKSSENYFSVRDQKVKYLVSPKMTLIDENLKAYDADQLSLNFVAIHVYYKQFITTYYIFKSN